MQYELGFGKGLQSVDVKETSLLDVLLPNPVRKELTGEAEVRRALAAPIGSAPLRELVKHYAALPDLEDHAGCPG